MLSDRGDVDDVGSSIAVSQVLAVVCDRRRRYIGYELKRTPMEWIARTGGALVYSEVDEADTRMRSCNAAQSRRGPIAGGGDPDTSKLSRRLT